jgi:hypothetical protein
MLLDSATSLWLCKKASYFCVVDPHWFSMRIRIQFRIRIQGFDYKKSVLRIHDILVWIRIRIRGPMPLTNGSGSRHWPSRCQQKTNFLTHFFCSVLFKATFTSFFKDKSQKESQNSRNQGFSYYFCMMIEGSGSGSRAGSGSGSIPLTSGSGSRRPKNTWIRIRLRIQIRNTAKNSKILQLTTKILHLIKDGNKPHFS